MFDRILNASAVAIAPLRITHQVLCGAEARSDHMCHRDGESTLDDSSQLIRKSCEVWLHRTVSDTRTPSLSEYIPPHTLFSIPVKVITTPSQGFRADDIDILEDSSSPVPRQACLMISSSAAFIGDGPFRPPRDDGGAGRSLTLGIFVDRWPRRCIASGKIRSKHDRE